MHAGMKLNIPLTAAVSIGETVEEEVMMSINMKIEEVEIHYH